MGQTQNHIEVQITYLSSIYHKFLVPAHQVFQDPYIYLSLNIKVFSIEMHGNQVDMLQVLAIIFICLNQPRSHKNSTILTPYSNCCAQRSYQGYCMFTLMVRQLFLLPNLLLCLIRIPILAKSLTSFYNLDRRRSLVGNCTFFS